MIERIKSVLASPDEFFASVEKEQGFGAPVKYLAVTSLVNLIGYIIVMSLTAGTAPFTPMLQIFAGSLPILAYIFTWILSVTAPFIYAALFHVSAYLFGGRNGYTQTYKAFVYGSTASNLIGWIPYAGILGTLYSVYLTVKGVSVLQDMSMGRAAAGIAAPIAIFAVLAFLLMGSAIFAYLGAPGA